jgi:hypothetical protein
MKILSNDRVFICGKTRSGKTTLLRYLASTLRRMMLLDSKGTLTDWDTVDATDKTIKQFIAGDDLRLRFVAPIGAESEYWQNACEVALLAGDTVVIVDEIYMIVEPGARPSPQFAALWTRGAEFGIGAWGSSQRPTFIPGFCISEAEHVFCFRLNKASDRARVADFAGDALLTPVPDYHGFYYWSQVSDRLEYIKDLKTETERG